MGNFNRDHRDSGRSSGGFNRGGFSARNRHDDRPRELFRATCSQCGQDCEIPFRPSGDRPVFCNSCFKSQGGPSHRFAPKSFDGNRDRVVSTGNAVTKEQFDILITKMDKILSILTTNRIAETAKPLVAVKEKKKKVVVKKSKGKKK